MAYEGIDRGGEARYGHDADADALAVRVVERVAELVAARPMPYCEGGGGRCYLHSQSGIDLDDAVTAGTRIPVGDEPRTARPHRNVRAAPPPVRGRRQRHLPRRRDRRAQPEALVDIIRGAFATWHA